MTGERDDSRAVYRISGDDRLSFLQGIVTNDVTTGGLIYTALLTPQGKYLADFFLAEDGESLLLDCHRDLADMLVKRLTMYKLRADVQITATDLTVARGLGDAPEGAYADPRDPSLGWRAYGDAPGAAPDIDWDAIRVAACVPEYPTELGPDTFILEAGFDRLAGVNFKKGCYVGQEVTARMKHKTELRKGFASVDVSGTAEPGTELVNADGKTAGTLHTRAGDKAIAYLRYDWAKGPLMAGDATVTWNG